MRRARRALDGAIWPDDKPFLFRNEYWDSRRQRDLAAKSNR